MFDAERLEEGLKGQVAVETDQMPPDMAARAEGVPVEGEGPELLAVLPEEGSQPEGVEDVPAEDPDMPPDEGELVKTCPRLLGGPKRGVKRIVKPPEAKPEGMTAESRLLILDTWQRSGLPAGDFASMLGLSKHTLYQWKRRFEDMGPGGLADKHRGTRSGSRLPEVTKRTILMLKNAHPEYGCQRISDEMARGPGLGASSKAVAKVLHESGYVTEDEQTSPHDPPVRRFERARPNQLWQTDLFTFNLKRQNRRVFLAGFMDDHSRFVVGYGLYGSASTALMLEVVRAAITSYGQPEEMLTDNGPQYTTWRGKSAFTKEMEKLGIKQIISRPKHPQTLGKIERFWGTLWRECVETAIFLDLEDARKRIGLFIDYYNFQRTHQGLEGLTPADRFFGAAAEVKATMKARVAANAYELARHGVPRKPFYMTGAVGGKTFSVHAAGERVILRQDGEEKTEIDLVPPVEPAKEIEQLPEPVCPSSKSMSEFDAPEVIDAVPAPGTSPLDEGLKQIAQSLGGPTAAAPSTPEGGVHE
jgi:transposase InsO family protein